MAKAQSPQPPATSRWINPDGTPALAFFQYMKSVDTLLLALAAGNIGPLISASNDSAAAAAGVSIGGLYSNAGAVRVRLT